jgi:long-chain fatty acid transport protein
LYEVNDAWNVGFSYKSPVWQERWSFNSVTRDLSPRRIGIQASVPAIYSWGVAFKGLPRTLIDVDLRYFDFANSALFGQRVIDGGLGWQSIFAVATGASYELTDRVTLRGGYLFNQNPIPAPKTLFNMQLPGIIEHHLSLGASLRLNDHITFTAAWTHGFRNSIQGPIGEIAGASVKIDSQVDAILAGINVQFGGKRHSAAAPPEELVNR